MDKFNMKLLTEYTSFKFDEEEEEFKEAVKDRSKPMFLTGIIQRCNTLNQNGRVYPRAVLLREIENYKKVVEERRAWGELNHRDEATISPKDICLRIIKIWEKGDEIWGKIRILDNPNGLIVRSMVESGGLPGISSRAIGSVRQEHVSDGPGNVKTVDVVQDDLQIVCWDIVSEPSTPGAYLALTEAKDISFGDVKKALSFNRTLPADGERIDLSLVSSKSGMSNVSIQEKKIVSVLDNLLGSPVFPKNNKK